MFGKPANVRWTRWSRWFKPVFIACLLTGFCLPSLLPARETAPSSQLSTISVDQLPREGKQTYELIFQGGPFPYEKDGVVFHNRERLLSIQPRGYYREYTVKTLGVSHRGVKRIVCGGPSKTPDVCYYTADHYASFRKIVR
ncbi:MAG: hypothetical protein RLZZ591_2189 [Pseudomonadota bacterium]|jgi:ribonuclease T1